MQSVARRNILTILVSEVTLTPCCTSAPVPWAVGLAQLVSPSPLADSQHRLAKGLFTPKLWSQHSQVRLQELSLPVAEPGFNLTLPSLSKLIHF